MFRSLWVSQRISAANTVLLNFILKKIQANFFATYISQHGLKNFFSNFFVKIGYVTLNPSQMECSRKCKDKFG
jgi:hypothetical protein